MPLPPRSRVWSRAPLLTKGILVIFLPILVLTMISGAVFVTGQANSRAEQQREAAESVHAAIDDLHVLTIEATEAVGDSFVRGVTEPDPVFERLIVDWDVAVDTLEAAAAAQPDRPLKAEVHRLRLATDELVAVVREWQGTATAPTEELAARGATAFATLEVASLEAAERAHEVATRYAHEYDRISRVLSVLLVVGTPMGIAGAIFGMMTFARSIVRRSRLLEANARALGEGRPLVAIDHLADELGQLGLGLDRAATLLGEREDALVSARASLEHLLDAGPLIAFRMDEQGTLTYVSQSVEGLLGWNPSELVGSRRGLLCIHPEDQPLANARAMAVLRGERDTPSALRFSTANGSSRWFNLSLKLDSARQGDVLGYALDIDGEHEAAEAVRHSEQRLALALEAGHMGAWDVDLITGVAEWSEQCERAHGLAPGTFGGNFEAWMDAIHADDRQTVVEESAGPMIDGGQWTSEYRSVAADGSVRWVETHGQALADENGAIVRLVGVSADVTARRNSDVALREATAEAERANEAKSGFLSRVSHELRTPLNAILGFGQLLEMDELTDAQTESVDQVLRGGRHLLAVIDDVLDISCIESGTLSVSIEPVELVELLRETIALVSPLAREHGVRLDLPDLSGVDLYVHADRRRLKQVILNLASNAIKFNRVGGVVTFTCRSSDPDRVRLDVADTGVGLSPELIERLFTPFDRLGAEQTAVEGTGIGLALSQRLAALLNGSISVESTLGVGTTFSLDLPAGGDLFAGEDVDDAGRHDGAVDLRGTILYIEDNPSNLKLMQRVFDRLPGIKLISATTGELGVAMAARVPVDMILLDLHLPDIDGEEVLRRLRELPANLTTPVVIVSADATPGRLERLRLAGAADYLTKPLDLTQVMRVTDGLLSAVTS